MFISQKTEIARSARGPKSRGPVQKTCWQSRTSRRTILVIWLQQITKFTVSDVNLETIIDMQSWCRTWPPNGSSRIRAKQKPLRKHKGACKSSWNRNRKPQVIYTHNSLEFGEACEDLSWNHCTSTPHRSETNAIAERAVRRVKEGTSAVLLQSGLDEKWWADSMECCTYLRNIQNLYLDCSSDTLCTRGNLERWLHGCGHWGVGNCGRIRNLLNKTQCKGSDVGGGQELRTSTLIQDHPIWGESRREFLRESEGVSTSTTSRLTSGCRWSDKRLLVQVRKLHIPPSRLTQSQTSPAEKRSTPHSTEIHWRLQNYSHEHGRYARKPHRRLLEYRRIKRFV